MFTITSHLTFDAGLDFSNFDNLKDPLKKSIADSLPNVDISMINLHFKNVTARLRRLIGTIVYVIITIKEKNVAEETRNQLTTNVTSFISTMAKKINQTEALRDAGVVVKSVENVTYTGPGK